MLSTVGAIILALQTTLTMFFISNPAIEIIPTPASISYQQNPTLLAIVDYYNNKGRWAGTFKIDSVVKFKIIKISETESVAHVKYHYVPLPNNEDGKTISGHDQRIFTISIIEDEIQVIKMGSYRSAKF